MFTKNHHKNEKSFNITITTPKGNTVGFINLVPQFCKAVTGKEPEELTADDLNALNNGDFEAYIRSLVITVTDRQPDEQIAVEDY